MNLINIIVLFLLLSPFYAVITDFKSGKIKNYFIFPFLLISLTLTFFIEWFYWSNNNIIWLIIIILFWYLFYKDNKWWAGDWKYLILIWLNSLMISFLLWFNINIINNLFFSIFSILLIYNLFFLIFKINEIKKIKFKNKVKINYIDTFFTMFFVYLLSFILWKYIWREYIYVIIFLSVILLLPYINLINNKYIKYLLIFSWISMCVLNNSYISILLIGVIYFVFIFLQSYSEQIFNVIDVDKIKLLDIKQGTILTKKAIDVIKDDTKFDYSESPLQWNEVFDLIWKYKKLWKNPEIIIYKDVKIWIIMYIWFILTIFYYI